MFPISFLAFHIKDNTIVFLLHIHLILSDFAGGKGAVRQIIEFILKAQEKWQAVIDSYLNIEDETDAKEVEKNISQ